MRTITDENFLGIARNMLLRFLRLKLSADFKILCVHHVIVALANGLIGLFLPIFLFEEFNSSIYWVIVFYAVGCLLYGILVPFGAMWMEKIGLKRSMIIARFFTILFYLCLYFLRGNPLLFAVLANVVLLIFRLFYWVPYHVNFVKFTDGHHRGRQMAYLAILGYLVGIGAPLLAGFLLTQFSFNFLFILVMIILGVAIIPLSRLNKTMAKFEFSYFQSWRELFKKANRRLLITYTADGAQGMVGVAIWPIFIYQILEKQYLAVGAVTALVVIGTIVCQLLMGQYTDKFSKRKLMHVGSFFYALGWLAKAFVATAFHIFIIGTFHSFMSIVLRTPFDALRYEQFSDRGSYVDEYTVLREMAIYWGHFLMGVLLIVLISLVGLKIAFPLAAAVSLLVNLL